MVFGFVGTGTISEAIIRGMRAAGIETPIVVSPRNGDIAARLAADLEEITIATSNQDVVERSDTVFLAIRPQIVNAVMAELHFRPEQTVVSFVATVSMAELAQMAAPATMLGRAVPLPFVEHRLGPTLVHPNNRAIADLFDKLGRAIVVTEEAEIDVLMAGSCTMGAYFTTLGWITSWLGKNGIDERLARSYITTLWSGLADAAARNPDKDFAELSREYSTAGGLNEQFNKGLVEAGMGSAYDKGFDALRERIEKGAKGRA